MANKIKSLTKKYARTEDSTLMVFTTIYRGQPCYTNGNAHYVLHAHSKAEAHEIAREVNKLGYIVSKVTTNLGTAICA